MKSLLVEVENKSYGSQSIIADLEFSMDRGDFVAIIGPSGTGKTSLLDIIAGVDEEFVGKVSFIGGAGHEYSNARPSLGFMFQDARLLPWLTVEENIKLVLQGASDDEKNRLHELLGRVDLLNAVTKYPGQLSGGMKRRVSLVRAFINSPKLLLMDEPFQSLDEPTANSLRELLLQFWEETTATVLFVTHDLREALSLADRILFLSDQPAHIILDFDVTTGRPRSVVSPESNAIYSELLVQYPGLLSGALNC